MTTEGIPRWIQWTDLTKQNYKKITNLYGGQPGTPDVQWLSDWDTNPSPTYRAADVIKGPIYSKDPKYLWFFDYKLNKLKFSANTPETLTMNPIPPQCIGSGADCSASTANCLDTSTEENCTLGWYFQKSDSAKCGGAKNHFFKGDYHGSNTVVAQWAYQQDDIFYKVPNLDSNSPNFNELEPQNFGGTFCANISPNWRMRSWMGCDCRAGKCQNFNNAMCGDDSVHGDEMENIDDLYIAYGPNPTAYRAQWQFIDEENAFTCCSQSKAKMDIMNPLQCRYGFNPTGSSKCPAFVEEYCSKYWGLRGNIIGDQCQAFLVNSDANRATTQVTLQNYITSRFPEDYISYPLWKAGDKLSTDYYNKYTCSKEKSENGCDIDPSSPCCRDDSTDSFFTYTVPYLCNFEYDKDSNHTPPANSMAGVCDAQLQYFCQSFTRDQLAADIALQNICGCNLLLYPDNPPPNPDVLTTDQMKLSRCGNAADGKCDIPSTSPYYINSSGVGPNCDIICNTSLVQSNTIGGPCKQQVCMIDDITINQINTNAGNNTITQNCDGGTCYIVGASFNEVNSQLGSNNIIQNCSTCYFTSGDDLITAVPYDCSTGEPINAPKGGDGKKDANKLWNFLTSNASIIIILLVIVGVVICFFIASYYNRKYKKQVENLIPPEGIAFGSEYWEQF